MRTLTIIELSVVLMVGISAAEASQGYRTCNFANEAGKQKCFGASGNQCEGGDPLHPPKYHQQNCTVDMFVTNGSIAHDNCCVRNPNGRACRGWIPKEDSPNRKNAPCSKEWDQAFKDSMVNRGRWQAFGPYYK